MDLHSLRAKLARRMTPRNTRAVEVRLGQQRKSNLCNGEAKVKKTFVLVPPLSANILNGPRPITITKLTPTV